MEVTLGKGVGAASVKPEQRGEYVKGCMRPSGHSSLGAEQGKTGKALQPARPSILP